MIGYICVKLQSLVWSFIQHYKWAIEAHDKYLDLKGPTSRNHRTYALPFDKKLRKKKKYKNIHKSGPALVNKIRDYHPLFASSKKDLDLKDNAMFICREGEAWRTPEMNKGNYWVYCFRMLPLVCLNFLLEIFNKIFHRI